MSAEHPAPSTPTTGPEVRVIQLPEVPPTDSESGASAPLQFDVNPLHQVKTRVQVCIGEAVATVGELLQAQPNALLRLHRTFDQPVDLLVEGQVIARGQLVAVDDQFAVRITELPIPLGIATPKV